MLKVSKDCPKENQPYQGICSTCASVLIRPYSAIKDNLSILDVTYKTIVIITECHTCGYEVYLTKSPINYENTKS